MLEKLNERIQGIVSWVIIGLIAITFTLFGMDYYMQSHQTSNAKVLVNDQSINNQAFDTSYRRSRAKLDAATTTTADDKRLQKQVLNEMIKNEVTVQAARHFGFEVTPTQAGEAILNIPQFQEDGHFSTQRYEQALSAALFTPETFQNEVRQGMLLNQQRFAFIGSSFVLPKEIMRFVSLYMQKRDYDYLTISPSLFVNQIQISSKDLEEYFKQHQNEFYTPEQVSLEYISLSMPEIKNKMNVSVDEIARYYDENKQNYLTPAQWKVAHILFAVPEGALESDIKQIEGKAEKAYESLKKNPELFNVLVTTLSDDKLSIKENGVLPWITAGQKEYDSILSTLTQPGQLTSPKRTAHGFELFKLIEYKPVSTMSLAEVTTAIKDQLLTERAQSKYTKTLEQLSDLSYQTPDSLTPVSDALKLPIQKTQPFTRQGGIEGLSKIKQVVNTAFNHEILDLNNNSEPIQINNDSVVVIRIGQHMPAKKQTFAEVKDQIERKLIQQRSQAMAKELGSNFFNSTENSKQLELINNYQLKWLPVTQASRESDQSTSQLNDLAFTLLKPGSRNGMTLSNGDYVVLRLKRIDVGRLGSLDKEQRDSLDQQIAASLGMTDYDLYVNQLMSKAKIEKTNTNAS